MLTQKQFNTIVRGFEKQGWRSGYDAKLGQCMLETDDGRHCAAGMLATKQEIAASRHGNTATCNRIDGTYGSYFGALGRMAAQHDEIAMVSRNFRRDFKSYMRKFAKEAGLKVPKGLE